MSKSNVVVCTPCGKPSQAPALACIHCGVRFPIAGRPFAAVAVVGALGCLAATLLPWVSDSDGTLNAMSLHPAAYMLLGAAAIGAVHPAQVLFGSSPYRHPGALFAALAAAVGSWLVGEEAARYAEKMGDLGMGRTVAYVGVGLLLLGATGMHVMARQRR